MNRLDPQRLVRRAWSARDRLGPRGRRVVRAVVDPLAGPLVGSVHHVATRRGLVALTLDDGPDPDGTDRVLAILAAFGVRATFFMLVEPAATHPGLVRRVVEAGHEVGLHGADHTPLTRVQDPEAVLGRARARLETLTGRPVRWFRPPYGTQDLGTFTAARRAGLEVVVWGPDGADWTPTTPTAVAERIRATTRAGDIVLLHDGRADPQPERPRVDPAATVERTILGLETVGLGCTSLGALTRTGRIRRTVWFRPAPEVQPERATPTGSSPTATSPPASSNR